MNPDAPVRRARVVARHRPRVLEASTAREILIELARTGADPGRSERVAPTGRTLLLRLDHLRRPEAAWLQREMRRAGGEAVMARSRPGGPSNPGSAVLIAEGGQYRHFAAQLRASDSGRASIGEAIRSALDGYSARPPPALRGVHRPIPLGDRTRVMGIVNVTPDSFFDGGRFIEPRRAVAQALSLAAEGADLLDVGGESTRPGARPVSATAELRRIRPVLEKLRDTSPVPISVDTRKAEVARVAFDLGADLVNDVEGLRDPAMRRIVARTGAPAIVMHMRGTPPTMQRNTEYDDVRGAVYASLATAVATAVEDGIRPEQLLLDPGLGFGKTGDQNLELLRHLGEFRSLGYPLVVGASRKSFLGLAVGSTDPADRLEAGIAASVLAAREGAAIVRVHDVRPTVRALRLADAVRRGGGEASDPSSKGPWSTSPVPRDPRAARR